MELIVTVVLSACISLLIADIKCKMHLNQIYRTFDELMENLKKVHDEYFEKLNQKCRGENLK